MLFLEKSNFFENKKAPVGANLSGASEETLTLDS